MLLSTAVRATGYTATIKNAIVCCSFIAYPRTGHLSEINAARRRLLHQLGWYTDAVLGNEIAAVRQAGIGQGIVDFISFKWPADSQNNKSGILTARYLPIAAVSSGETGI